MSKKAQICTWLPAKLAVNVGRNPPSVYRINKLLPDGRREKDGLDLNQSSERKWRGGWGAFTAVRDSGHMLKIRGQPTFPHRVWFRMLEWNWTIFSIFFPTVKTFHEKRKADNDLIRIKAFVHTAFCLKDNLSLLTVVINKNSNTSSREGLNELNVCEKIHHFDHNWKS